jgi:arabinogalactan endo-1,4-beta-galactosidase
LSFTPEISQSGFVYSDKGVASPILAIMKSNGINTVRIRLWNHPADGHSGLTEVAQFAKAVKAAGMKWWLDYHYSDTWADPGKQTKPAAWASQSFKQLQDSVYTFTTYTLTYLKQQGVAPDYIQLGNEINSGMLWDDGKVLWTGDTRWSNLGNLLKQGVKACRKTTPEAKIILHYAGFQGASDFFQSINGQQVDYDIIGLSYYPWWHGTSLDSLGIAVKNIHQFFRKPVLIAETAYAWTTGGNDGTNNIFGNMTAFVPNIHPLPDGQAQFLSAVKTLVTTNSNETDSGICYWAPDWVAFKGQAATDGSPWENMALFDFQGKALPGLAELGK